MNRTVLLSSAMSLALMSQASADDLTVSSTVSTQLSTATASNSTPGNITVASGGAVQVNVAGAAITVNSSNNVVNNGTISNLIGTDAVGVQLTGGFTGSFTNNGTINLPGTGTPPTSTGQFGIVVTPGTGPLTGNIILGSASSITISGLSAQGIDLQTEITGNVTLAGTIKASGSLANGLISVAPIDGALVNKGTITTDRAGAAALINADSPISVGGSVGLGILNAGPLTSSDTTAAAVLSTVGPSPSLLVAPSVAGDTADLSIGVLSDTTSPGFSFINRGKLLSTADQPGLSATAMQIGNSGDNTSGHLTTLAGGILNSGSIAAISTSDLNNTVSATSAAANATSVVIGIATNVPNFTNDGRGNITATTGGSKGGNAFGLSIVAGATFPVLNNAGTISASANTTDATITSLQAYAIQDASGTLTTVSNSGTIAATATVLNTGVQKTVAADLSASTSSVTFTNTGTVTGDILFGKGTANQLTITGANASVSGAVTTFGTGVVNVVISGGGAGGTLTTSHVTQVGTLQVGAGGTLDIAAGNLTPVVFASGAVNFDAASHFKVTPVSLLPADSSLTLIHSDTSISFGNFTATTSSFQIPFLFTGNLTTDSKNLVLNLKRKSASDLGLTGNAASIYEPALAAATLDSGFGGALAGLGSSAAVSSALSQMLPLNSGAERAAAEMLTDIDSNPVGSRQRSLLFAPADAAGFGMWAQGLYGLFSGSSADSFTGHGGGGAVGADFNQNGRGHFGAALTIYDANLTDKAPLTGKTDGVWYVFSPYIGFRGGDFVFDAQLNVGGSSLTSTRTVTVGSVTRTASGKPSEMIASGGASAGYLFDLGGIRVMPEIAVDVLDLYDHGYMESGGGEGVDLSVSARHQNSVRTFAGITAGGSYEVGGMRLAPQAIAGWSQELASGSTSIDAAFAATPNSSFTVSGPTADKSKLVAGAGLDYGGATWSLGLRYNAMIGTKALSQLAGINFSARF